MSGIKWDNLFNKIFLVIVENFEIKISQQIKIDLITIIPDTHYA